MTDDRTIAASFKALSHPRRMKLFRLLCERPEVGKSTQTLLTASGLPQTSFTHHVREMARAGLLRKRRKGAIVQLVLTPRGLNIAMQATEQALRKSARPLRHAA